MHEKVKRFIERKEQERAKKREKHLIYLGLIEKEYSETQHPDYPHWDSETGKYYRAVPIEVTNEEYGTICSYVKDSPSSNSVATVLKIIAWFIIVVGFIAGVSAVSSGDFGVSSGMAIWIPAIIGGVLFLGLAEIIILLQAIVDKRD